MTAPLYRLAGIAASIDGRVALRRVSFDVPLGGSVGLVGETGSGKSLTCRAMVGLLDAIGGEVTAGEMQFRGEQVLELSQRRWRELRGSDIGMVPQASISGLDPVRRIGIQMKEAVATLSPDADREARSIELLEAMRLPDAPSLMRKFPHELSGGMRQRVMIALSIVGEPEVLIADEATTALDVTVQKGILELLVQLRAERGMALLVVTHDLAIVEEVCDAVAIMYAGTTVEAGPTADVVTRPLHPYTKGLIAAQPEGVEPGRPLRAIPGTPPGLGETVVGCPFAGRCEYAQERCRNAPVELEEVESGHLVACLRAGELAS